MDLASELARWHDFFVAAAGAAVVLFGLVFIGLSIHLDRQSVGPPIVGLAVGSATTLFYPVLVCLVMLFPPAQPWIPSVALAAVGLLAVISTSAPLVDRDLRRALGGVWPARVPPADHQRPSSPECAAIAASVRFVGRGSWRSLKPAG